jgi:hypothetical protein
LEFDFLLGVSMAVRHFELKFQRLEFASLLVVAVTAALRRTCILCHIFNNKRLGFGSLLGVAVATAPKGRRTAAPPLGTPAAPTQ